MTSDFALELCALSRRFALKRGLFRAPGEIKAVDNVTLRVAKGETLGLVGESGCGKSTLAKMLLGLLAPSSGNVLLHGREIDPRQRRAHARRIQPIFQDPYSSLNPRRTVADIVGVPLRIHQVGSRAEQQRTVRETLDLVGMPERTHQQYPNQLSGGQRQRVAIARALVLRPDILVCDEPTSALDVSVQAQILNLLMDLKAEFGLTYFFISHDLGVVEHISDRVVIMYLGRVVETAATAELFDRPLHPYTVALLNEVPRLSNRKRKFETIKGEIPSPLHPPSGCHFHPRCPMATDRCRVERPALRPVAPRHQAACHLI
jgi:peptide/nickel transport system ATP-binding protein